MTIKAKNDNSKHPTNLIIAKGDYLFTPTKEKLQQWKEINQKQEWRKKQKKKDRIMNW